MVNAVSARATSTQQHEDVRQTGDSDYDIMSGATCVRVRPDKQNISIPSVQ